MRESLCDMNADIIYYYDHRHCTQTLSTIAQLKSLTYDVQWTGAGLPVLCYERPHPQPIQIAPLRYAARTLTTPTESSITPAGAPTERTDPQTNNARPPQAGPITIHCTAKLSAQCNQRMGYLCNLHNITTSQCLNNYISIYANFWRHWQSKSECNKLMLINCSVAAAGNQCL